MDASIPRKKRHSEPVIIPVTIVREGCKKIAENISELSDHASRFLEFNEDIVSRRIAYILVIHAMDEAGKLLDIMKKMVIAEGKCDSDIEVEAFYSHGLKGLEAGTIGLLAVDWLDELAAAMAARARIDSPPPSMDYRAHLEHLRCNFKHEREQVLYVNLENDKWTSPSCATESDIAMDAFALNMLAMVTLAAIDSCKPFRELSEMTRQLSSKSFVDELSNKWTQMLRAEERRLRGPEATNL